MKEIMPFIFGPIIFVLFFSSGAYSQKKRMIGINISNEMYPARRLNLTPGITYEMQFTRHSGLETGILYRSDKLKGVVSFPNNVFYTFTISRRYLTPHILYKYYSKMVNFSIGPTFDYFVSWKQKSDTYPDRIENYTDGRRLKIGYLAKLSKSFCWNQKFIIEPEFRLNNFGGFDFEFAALGVGLSGKYIF